MKPDKEVTDLWIAMNLATRKVYREMEITMKKEGLPSLKWYDILWELDQNRQGLRPQELVSKLLFEQSNISKLLKRINQEGFIKDVVFEGDRRGRIIQITEAGCDVRLKMWKIYGPLINEHIGDLIDRGDCEQAAQTLRSLII